MFPWRIVSHAALLSLLYGCSCADAKQPARDDSVVDEVIANIGQVRESLFRSNERLEGKVRKGAFSITFRVALKSSHVEITFDESGSRFRIPVEGTGGMQEFQDGRWTSSQATLTTRVGETVVSYEDLAFRFLFWRDPKRVGTGIVRTKPCAIVRFTAGANESSYSFVEVWFDEKSTAPLLAVAYGENGEPVKRFDPVKFHRVGDDWVVQSLRVSRLQEATGKGEPTYIEFASVPDSPKP